MGLCLDEAEAETGFQQWGAPPSACSPFLSPIPSSLPGPQSYSASSPSGASTAVSSVSQHGPTRAYTGHCGRAHFQELKVVPRTVPRPGPAPAPRSTPASRRSPEPALHLAPSPRGVSPAGRQVGECVGLGRMTVAESPLSRPVSSSRPRGCCRSLAFLQLVSRLALCSSLCRLTSFHSLPTPGGGYCHLPCFADRKLRTRELK